MLGGGEGWWGGVLEPSVCYSRQVCRGAAGPASLLHVGVSVVGQRQRLQSVVHLASLRPLWFFTAGKKSKEQF